MIVDSKERRLLTIKVSNTTPYCVTQIIERLVMLISKIPYDTVSICNAYLRVSAWMLSLEEGLEFYILFLHNIHNSSEEYLCMYSLNKNRQNNGFEWKDEYNATYL